MKLLFLFFTLFTIPLMGQQTDSPAPADIVQQQLVAYNNRDIDSFMALFGEPAEIYNLGDKEPLAGGMEQVRALYADLFAKSPQLHSTVINRTVLGNKVIDYEQIAGRRGVAEITELIVIYEVVDQKIRRCFVIRK